MNSVAAGKTALKSIRLPLRCPADRRRSLRRRSLSLALVLGLATVAQSESPAYGESESWKLLRPVIGWIEQHRIEAGQTLHDVAFVHRLGFEAVRRLNPDLDPWLPGEDTVVRLPTRYVLPPAEPTGLVINLPEMRLYDFLDAPRTRVLAIAIGDREDPTPIKSFKVGPKQIDPFWKVPKSIRRERPELPPLVPPGPENPLGTRWMTLGRTSYGIHGTNVRWSIGRGSTHGCVRLYEDVMQALFDRVPEGTAVQIVYAPYKWGRNGKDLLLEAHHDVYGRIPARFEAAMAVPKRLGLLANIDIDRAWQVVEEAEGIPVVVGTLP